ncbi:CBN-SRE-18 protein [Caenorhabditis brenneri]|uniref:CBN-SRE-18 protein n=1 Tax=Caenorhabditis brenneri TaxID=135651 RepID=G0NYH4_CAEBE|nr:CBN-SRE-18 protein [Caenorhabditis brenneri]
MRLEDQTLYKNGTYPYFATAFSVIIILNVLSILYYCFNLYVSLRVKHYKTNIHKIHQAIYATCPFSSIFMIIDGVFNILGKRQALFALVAIMLERICATYYIKDYEKNQRPVIGYGIIIFLLIISIATSCIFAFTNLVVVFVGGHFLFCVICYVVSLITYRLNRKYYYEHRAKNHSYSLGERYQISENIRLYKFFSHYLFVLAVFPLICTSITFIDNYDSNPMHREIFSIVFDFSFTSLCFLAPYLTYKMSEPWQLELDVILMKMGIKKPNKVNFVRDNSKVLRGTFGEEMNVERSKHTDVYFTQLKSSWNLMNESKV